jgi:hypothetical protein
MKVRLSLLTAALVALVATVAAPAKDRPAQPGACKPTVSFILKGTLASVDAAGGSFAMDVKAANKHGRQYKGQNGVQVMVDQKTKFRRNGRAQLSDLVVGDRLVAQVRACKDAAQQQPAADPNAPQPAPAAAPALLAKRVVAHPAKPASPESDDSSSGSPTTP